MKRLIASIFLFISCSHNIAENLPEVPSIQAIVFSDQPNKIAIVTHNTEKQTDWEINYKYNGVRYPFTYQPAKDSWDDSFYFKDMITNIFGKAHYIDMNYSPYVVQELPPIIEESTLTLEMNHNGVFVEASSLISPKVVATSFGTDLQNQHINVHLTFPAGRYHWKLSGDVYSINLSDTSFINAFEASGTIASVSDKDSVVILVKDKSYPTEPNSPSLEQATFATFSSTTYSPELHNVLTYAEERITSGDDVRLYELLGDDLSTSENMPGNLSPFNGYFAVITRSQHTLTVSK